MIKCNKSDTIVLSTVLGHKCNEMLLLSLKKLNLEITWYIIRSRQYKLQYR
jgi:hypothetical protein